VLLDIGADMKPFKTFVALPIITSGLLLLSAGSGIFCFGCWLSEVSADKYKLAGRKK